MSIDGDHLRPDKLAFQGRLAVLQEHRNHLSKIALQFLHRGALGVRAGKTGNIADQQTGIGVAFNDCGVNSHRRTISHSGHLVAVHGPCRPAQSHPDPRLWLWLVPCPSRPGKQTPLERDNVKLFTGHGGALATLGHKKSIPPPRSAPKAGLSARQPRPVCATRHNP